MIEREQAREEIRIQEYVRLQETFNIIIRSLERIERSDSINRANAVKRNNEADVIHSEYESMKEAFITQCLCLQVGMTETKFQSEQVKKDLTDQIERWKSGIQGEPSQKLNEAIVIVNKAIDGEMKFDDYEIGSIPTNHSQAVGAINMARSYLEEKTNLAITDPQAYYQNNEYRLKIGEKFISNLQN